MADHLSPYRDDNDDFIKAVAALLKDRKPSRDALLEMAREARSRATSTSIAATDMEAKVFDPSTNPTDALIARAIGDHAAFAQKRLEGTSIYCPYSDGGVDICPRCDGG